MSWIINLKLNRILVILAISIFSMSFLINQDNTLMALFILVVILVILKTKMLKYYLLLISIFLYLIYTLSWAS